jgi:hypothetical protein
MKLSFDSYPAAGENGQRRFSSWRVSVSHQRALANQVNPEQSMIVHDGQRSLRWPHFSNAFDLVAIAAPAEKTMKKRRLKRQGMTLVTIKPHEAIACR